MNNQNQTPYLCIGVGCARYESAERAADLALTIGQLIEQLESYGDTYGYETPVSVTTCTIGEGTVFIPVDDCSLFATDGDGEPIE